MSQILLEGNWTNHFYQGR